MATPQQKSEMHRFIMRNFTYDDLCELRDIVEDEIRTRITIGEYDMYSDSPEIYKFYAEEEEAHNEL